MNTRATNRRAPERRVTPVISGGRRRDPRWRSASGSLLAGYLVALALIAFWPVPVDRGGRGVLEIITQALPWLTYDVIEFVANVVLFLPFGGLLAIVLNRRWVVVPLALVVSASIEITQAALLVERTPDVSDVIANTLGAAVGVVVVALGVKSQRGTTPSRTPL